MILLLIMLFLGLGIVTLLVLAKVFPLFGIQLRDGFGNLADICKRGCAGCLRLGLADTKEEVNTTVLFCVALVGIWHLATSLVVLVAEYPFLVLRVANFFGLGNTAPVLGNLGLLAGLAVWLVPGMWFLIFLEIVRVLPVWLGLLRLVKPDVRKSKIFAWAVGLFSALLVCMFMGIVFIMNVYTQCKLQGDGVCSVPLATHVLAVSVFNTLLMPTLPLVLIGLILGITALIGCLFAFLYCVFRLFHFFLGLGKNRVVASPHDLGIGIVTPPVEHGNSCSIPDKDVAIMPDFRTIIIHGFAGVGARLVTRIHETVGEMGAEQLLFGYSSIDLDRRIEKTSFPALHRDLTPYDEIERVKNKTESGGKGKMSKEDAYAKLAYDVNKKVVAECGEKQGVTVIVTAPLSLLPSLVEPLCKLKGRLFHPHILLVTARSKRDEVVAGLDVCISSLARAGIETYVYDVDSEYAGLHADEAHEKAVAGTIFGASVAHELHKQNMTFAEVGERVRSYSPGIGLVFAQAQVADGKRAFWLYALLAKVFRKMGKRGKGDFDDLVVKSKQCTEDILEEVEQVNNGNSTIPFFVYTIPVSFTDLITEVAGEKTEE